MTYDLRTPRSRGSLCGVALILLGAWGGLAPIAGPAFGFGFAPDRAWHLTAGRLYLSALPGAVVLLAGLVVLITRGRVMGGLFATLAALCGAWFITGAQLAKLMPADAAASIVTGSLLGTGTSRAVLTSLACYAGTGALIVFVAAIALGRFSLAAYRDAVADDFTSAQPDAAALAGAGSGAAWTQGFGSYQAAQNPPSFPPAAQQAATEQFPGTPAGTAGRYASADPFGGQQYPPHDPFGLTQDYGAPAHPASQSPFPPAPNPFPPAQDTTRPQEPDSPQP